MAAPESRSERLLSDDVRTLLLCGVGMAAAMGIGRFAYTPILPIMKAEVLLSNGESGMIASANHLGYLIGAIASGALIRRHGFQRVLSVGLVLVSLATATMALTTNRQLWASMRLIVGIGSGFAFVALSALTFVTIEKSGRAGRIILSYGGVGIGVIVSTLMIHIAASSGWESAAIWITMGIVSFVCTAVVMVFLRSPAVQTPTETATTNETKSTTRGLALLTFAYGSAGFGYIIAATYLVTIVRDADLGRGFETASWVVFGAASIPSIRFWTSAANRFGRIPALIGTFVVQAFGVGLLAFSDSKVAVLVTGFLLGGTFIGTVILALGQARIIASHDPTRAIVGLTIAYGVGQILGPTIGGWLADRTGDFGAASLLAAGVLILGAIASQISATQQVSGGLQPN